MAKVVLYAYAPLRGLLSISPFCCKVHMGLRLKGIAYETRIELMAGRVARNGQLPVLAWDGEKLAESSAILRELDRRVPEKPLVPSDPKLAAEADVLEDWSDESLYWFGGMAKFWDDEGWRRVREDLAKTVPLPLRAIGPGSVRRKYRAALRTQGLARRMDRIDAEFERHLDSLETKLDGKRYLVGDAISIADVSVVCMLGQLTTGYTPRFGAAIAKRTRLAEYLGRLRRESNTDAGQ
jgi:glutathione S-transferase